MASFSRRRIGFFSYATGYGGAELYIKQLVEAANAEGNEVFFFYLSGYPMNLVFGEKLDGVKFISLDSALSKVKCDLSPCISLNLSKVDFLKRSWRNVAPFSLKLLIGSIKDVLKFKKVFAQYSLDLFHYNASNPDLEVIPLAVRLAGVRRIIATYHTTPSGYKTRSWICNVINRVIASCVTWHISPSAVSAKFWPARLFVSRSRFKVIHNGIQFDSCAGRDKQVSLENLLPGVTSDVFVLGIPARLDPVKGHVYLLNALPEIIRQCDGKVCCLCIGDGEKDELVGLVRKLGIEDKVMFLGHRKDVMQIFKFCNLVCLPSVGMETLPYALIEAQFSGKAVVASNFSGIPEIVENGVTGLLVPPRDSEALAEAILKLIRDPQLCQAMGERGRERARKLFSLDRMLFETFQLYKEDLNNQTPI